MAAAAHHLRILAEEMEEAAMTAATFPDERLKLLYVCAHPAIEPTARTALMLQTVLGLDAARIASAFVVSPATLSQRLVRAKAKIREAGIAFEVPDESQLADRTQTVLDSVYAAYTLGRGRIEPGSFASGGLADEAIWLAGVLAELLPGEPEVLGLLSLLLFCDSRRDAGRDATTGAYIPLSAQNLSSWSSTAISQAETLLKQAARLDRPGRYQLEAAIQSVHADRRRTGMTNWPALRTLYERLIAVSPTLGAYVARAAVTAEIDGPAAGLSMLSDLPEDVAENYQPYWAVRADLSTRSRQITGAIDAFTRAIALTDDPAVKVYLACQKSASCGESE